ncbi:aminopeptidase O [Thunnus maccoyii]|uniref:aminopeptidase O n=1 Tax=Thunnus maccoyii TaxID=8240 RepID=UPI001C4B0400|nr:aminopeptidase O [Thunnus maccoyii]XP_042277266.1 aminopeptidase O [Thunnus maccoyii]XP_042277267.1 aminopeptidase O [Thunnus maccoyii]
MEQDGDLNPDTDDLPLRANTNHILVKHYVLDLTVHFDRKVISGSVTLFLQPCSGVMTRPQNGIECGAGDVAGTQEAEKSQDASLCSFQEVDTIKDHARDLDQTRVGTATVDLEEPMIKNREGFGNATTRMETIFGTQAQAEAENIQSSRWWENTSDGDFTLVLDCCDLAVSKVEEVDVTSVSAMFSHLAEVSSERTGVSSVSPQAALIQNIISMPSIQWRQQHQLFSQCSHAPAVQDGSSLHFHTDRWSLQVRKRGVSSPQEFPRVLRICYETRPTGGSVRWTKDQDNRLCVYTAGSPINNRALFPCQEPPVAMSTWQATVRAPSECVVLMSGEEQAVPIEDGDTCFLIWNYYVTMPMPASTFTLAVGHWRQVTAEIPLALEKEMRDRMDCGKKPKLGAGEWTEAGLVSSLGSSTTEVVKGSTLQTGSGDQTTRSDSAFCYSSLEDERLSVTDYSDMVDDSISCSHGDYPCRFTERSAGSQRVIPHRVFAPVSLLQKAQIGVLPLLPRCLAAANSVLGVHPFPRLDVLIVPAGFSSLGMASPHIIFLSQSVLCAGSPGSEETALGLCGSRLCHEIAHSWFGLVIGARDWTEEWISEGFATYLEDIIWAKAQQLSLQEIAEQSDLKALLRWRRLSDELQNSEEELQILRPNMENTGQVSESGSSTVKHALNPDKSFMQVHYLKGYFLLKFLASQVGEQQFRDFFRLFVKKYHGQLVLSQDFLQMLLITFPDMARKGLTLSAIYADWLDRPGIPKWLYERSAVWSQARLVEEVKAEVVKWILLSQSQGKGRKRKRMEPKVNYKEVTSDQLVMLLELLLEEADLSVTTMRTLQRTYDLQNQDAEVRHRWCELVVKHGHTQAYGDVEHFLVHDQAMGVYLYGELMVQEDPEQQALARRCLSLISEEMDQSARRVVEEMVL